jgi:hypothetical protein
MSKTNFSLFVILLLVLLITGLPFIAGKMVNGTWF